jgi:hypothetical protein
MSLDRASAHPLRGLISPAPHGTLHRGRHPAASENSTGSYAHPSSQSPCRSRLSCPRAPWPVSSHLWTARVPPPALYAPQPRLQIESPRDSSLSVYRPNHVDRRVCAVGQYPSTKPRIPVKTLKMKRPRNRFENEWLVRRDRWRPITPEIAILNTGVLCKNGTPNIAASLLSD